MQNEDALPGPATLTLKPTSCTLRLTCSRIAQEQSCDRLNMMVRLGEREDVRTPDGRSFQDIDWSITFHKDQKGNELTERHNAVGLLTYAPELAGSFPGDEYPESAIAWVNLDASTFDLLRDNARAGSLPDSINLHILGLEYGWEPDASGKVWDVNKHRNAVITSIQITTNLGSPFDPSQHQAVERNIRFPTKQDDLTPPSIQSLLQAVALLNTRFAWGIGILAMFLLVLILRR